MTVKLFRSVRVVTPQDPGRPLAGPDQGRVADWERGALLVREGRVAAVGSEEEVLREAQGFDVDQEIFGEGRCLVPGFVDPHTHMCFARRREKEFGLRLQGTPYLDILKAGGGILSSVRAVREASDEALYQTTLAHATSALRRGSTTVEIKSGYGLDTATELRMLQVVRRIARETPLDVVATFMGAHAVPEEYRGRGDDFVALLVEEMIPAVQEQGIASFCDVFCEEGVFSVPQTRRILEAARRHGLGLKVHADEVHDLGGAELAAELGAISAEHLLAAREEGLRAMAKAGTVAVLLPATAYSLRKPYAAGRTMIDLALPVALATDCNPGSSFTESMPFVFGLAVLNMYLSPEEALTGATLNAAYAIGQASQVGSLDRGKKADFLLLDGDSPAILAYHAGVSPVTQVYKMGERVA
ncbi:MAG TPA: imidazolonepropionase [Synergistaceae bacterium]|nr:imidazolonepropionase [Synergistaceae bacterium]HQH79099.1 imidazolonepropionase [Synergistaceae bacterium]